MMSSILKPDQYEIKDDMVDFTRLYDQNMQADYEIDPKIQLRRQQYSYEEGSDHSSNLSSQNQADGIKKLKPRKISENNLDEFAVDEHNMEGVEQVEEIDGQINSMAS